MPITELQRELRSKHIGSSDAPAIIGVDPYRNAYDVWLEKTGRLEPSDDSSEAADIGNMIESSLLDWAASEIGARIIKNQRRVNGLLAANHDALVRGHPWGLEAKTTGILTPHMARDEWGDAGTDQVPDRVLVQCHHQMIVSDLELVYVPALIGGRGRVLFEIKRSAELYDAMRERLAAWWRDHVEADVPPAGISPSLDTLKRARREPNKVVDVPADLFLRWTEARIMANAAKEQEEDAKAAVLAAMGDAEEGRCELGAVTYFEQERRFIDLLALREKYPDAALDCERLSRFRVARYKKPKKS